MTAVARRVQSLTLEARLALLHYQDMVARTNGNPMFDREARYGALLEPLIHVGGTWGDVVALLALHDPDLEWANRWHARTVWVTRGGSVEGIAALAVVS